MSFYTFMSSTKQTLAVFYWSCSWLLLKSLLGQIFRLEISETFCVNGKAFFSQVILTCNLCGRLKTYIVVQEDNKVEVEILCKWDGNFHSDWLELKEWHTSEGHPFVPENFCLICVFSFSFQLVEPKNLAKWKAFHFI